MNFVSRSVAIGDLCERFDALIGNYRRLRATVGKGAAIETTKLWAYRKKFETIDQLDGPIIQKRLGI
jgi:hypothetical protein